jgi:hypothetical protein
MASEIIETITGDIFEFSTSYCDGCALWNRSGFSGLWYDWQNFFQTIKDRMYKYEDLNGEWIEPPLNENSRVERNRQILNGDGKLWAGSFSGKLYRINPPAEKLEILYIHPNAQNCLVQDINCIPNMVGNALDALRHAKAKSIALNGIQVVGDQTTNEEIARIMINTTENWLEARGGIDKIYFVDLRGGFDVAP